MGLLLRKLSLSCCFFFPILKISIFFLGAVLDSVSRSVGELFPVFHKCKQHFVEKTPKDSGGFYDCVNFFGSPKKQTRQDTNVFVWGTCFQPQIVTQLVEGRESICTLCTLCFQNASSLIFMMKRFVLYLVFVLGFFGRQIFTSW
jgi:hypothetical protein